MPIGEDLPSLIPIAIITVMIFLTITFFLTDNIQKNQATALHRTALTIAEKDYLENKGMLDHNQLENNPNYLLSTSTQLSIRKEITNLETAQTWERGNPQDEYDVVIALPVIIQQNSNQHTGKLAVKIKRS